MNRIIENLTEIFIQNIEIRNKQIRELKEEIREKNARIAELEKPAQLEELSI